MDKKMIVKAVAHIHSDWSYDGTWPLSKMANLFGKIGYQVILTTEHDSTFDCERWLAYQQACSAASTENILVIPGIEYSDTNNTIHVLVWGISEFLGNNQPTGDILNKVSKRNGICVLAHPSRRDAWQRLDNTWLPLFHGIELWNRKFDGIAPSQEASDLLKLSGKSTPFVGLDFHQANQIFPLTMMIQINDILSADDVLTSLRAGHSYPLALGFSAMRFTGGFLALFVKSADRIRRLIAKSIKHK
jgi:hypothetical protein